MERRRPSPARESRIGQPSAGGDTAVLLPLPHIADFIADGQTTLGQMDPIGCIAIANDSSNTFAMLVRDFRGSAPYPYPDSFTA